MTGLSTKLRTYRALGLANIAKVARYRMGLRGGWHPVLKLEEARPSGPFFGAPQRKLPFEPRNDWRDSALWFGRHEVALGAQRPDWHANPLGGGRSNGDRPWHLIPDVDPVVGDIKTLWEASRFDWLLAMATRAAAGDAAELDRLNDWLEDWSEKNSPYRGPNWKCGQEASIRVLHLCLAAVILGQQGSPSDGLKALLSVHLKRIAPTIDYAVAQANNHATSEAAALLVGGLLIGDEGAGYAKTGRRLLEKLATRLIAQDGTFSQYSLVYHRVMLDTYAFVALLQEDLDAERFSAKTRSRLAAATEWLAHMVDRETGDGPNLGSNDGARILALTDGPFRDFRPTLQTSAALFLGKRAIAAPGPWDRMLSLFRHDAPDDAMEVPQSRTFADGGFHVLKSGKASALMRFGQFKFRPAQADLMHVDLMVDGENILRDDGTFSYADPDHPLGGVGTHNSIQIDAKQPMHRLSRFLWGDWINAEFSPVEEGVDGVTAIARQEDVHGHIHARRISLFQDRLICEDTVGGVGTEAILRWRLRPAQWVLDGYRISDGKVSILVEGEAIRHVRLVDGIESRYYLDRQIIPVLEVVSAVPAEIRTEIRF